MSAAFPLIHVHYLELETIESVKNVFDWNSVLVNYTTPMYAKNVIAKDKKSGSNCFKEIKSLCDLLSVILNIWSCQT